MSQESKPRPPLVIGALLSTNAFARRATRVQIALYSLGFALAVMLPVYFGTYLYSAANGGLSALGVAILIVFALVVWGLFYASGTHRTATRLGRIRCLPQRVEWREMGEDATDYHLDPAGFGHIGLQGRTQLIASHVTLPEQWLRVRISRFACEDEFDHLEEYLVAASPDGLLSVGQDGEARATRPWTIDEVFPIRNLVSAIEIRPPRDRGAWWDILVGGETWGMDPESGKVFRGGELLLRSGRRWFHAPSGFVVAAMREPDAGDGRLFLELGTGATVEIIDEERLVLRRPGSTEVRCDSAYAGEVLKLKMSDPVHPVEALLALIVRRRRGLDDSDLASD